MLFFSAVKKERASSFFCFFAIYLLIDKDYGSAFEIPLVIAKQTIHPKAPFPELYQLRHLMTFKIYFLDVLAIYAITKSIYYDYRAGLLAALFIIISPKPFAKSFYNSRDIIFMATIAIIYYILEICNLKWLLILSFTSTYSTNVRNNWSHSYLFECASNYY